MVILKKIKASTLMETLVATVLIVVIFMLASMILNNLFLNTIRGNTRVIDAYFNELEYLYTNDKLVLPYYDDFKSWKISVDAYKTSNQTIVSFEALNIETNQNISKQIIEN